MTAIQEKVERLLALTNRLTEALLGDVDALERGRPSELCTIGPETQQLLSVYAREAAGIKAQIKLLSADARKSLTLATEELHQALAQHERRLSRVRRASEGMIRAIVEDVERRRRVTRVYGPRSATKPQPGAMLYNKIV